MQETTKKIVFVLSPGRSGSSLLDLILGSHSKCTSLGEFWVVNEDIQRDHTCQFCADDCSLWEKFENVCSPPRFHEAAFEAFDTHLLIDSSKNETWLEEARHNTDAEIKVIRLTRRALPSLGRSKRKAKSLSDFYIQKWVRRNLELNQYVDTLPKDTVKWVQYEDLCTDTGAVIEDICRFIGMDYEPAMLEYWKHPHHVIRANGVTLALVRLYHGYLTPDELHPDAKFLYDNYGFGIQLDTDYMNDPKRGFSEEEKRRVGSLAGWIDKRNGYLPDAHSRPHPLAPVRHYVWNAVQKFRTNLGMAR